LRCKYKQTFRTLHLISLWDTRFLPFSSSILIVFLLFATALNKIPETFLCITLHWLTIFNNITSPHRHGTHGYSAPEESPLLCNPLVLWPIPFNLISSKSHERSNTLLSTCVEVDAPDAKGCVTSVSDTFGRSLCPHQALGGAPLMRFSTLPTSYLNLILLRVVIQLLLTQQVRESRAR